jgi:hypothetical protein
LFPFLEKWKAVFFLWEAGGSIFTVYLTDLMRLYFLLCMALPLTLVLTNCSRDPLQKEQISVAREDDTDVADTVLLNSIQGSQTNQTGTKPSRMVLTGMPEHCLIPVYKQEVSTYTSDPYSGYRSSYYYDAQDGERRSLFMPGIDLLQGYNLLNVAHYDLKEEKLNYLFEHPVLVRSLYYPSFVQDSLDGEPINRNYYLVTAYDADTNGDTLINKLDLRRFYYFNAAGKDKLQLVPPDYSVVRSQYDPRNDIMYIFARHDADKSGTAEGEEPLHIFWVRLKQPTVAKRMY